MVKLGKVYGNLMVDLRATNDKLRDRGERIVMAVAGLSRPAARRLLAEAGGGVKTAIVMHFRKTDRHGAARWLRQCNGSLRKAIQCGRAGDESDCRFAGGQPIRKRMSHG
jgi:N-acetylmuramic acid 6-phosphate etherase